MKYITVAKGITGLKEIINIIDVAISGKYCAGKYTKKFEEGLGKFLGRKFVTVCNSGSSANLLAISALCSPKLRNGMKHGDEVITAACGFPTTINPIIQNNLVPVFIDIKLETLNIDETKIESAITPKTKAIVVANTLGNPAKLDVIQDICKKNKLWLVVDNCDGLGSTYQEKQTGAWGDISTQSFYPAHHITMGEGGAVSTDNGLLNKIILSLRDWGRDCYCEPNNDNTCKNRFTVKYGNLPLGYDHKYVYSHIGYNLKATDIQASIGVAQLDRLKGFVEKRISNWIKLYAGLNSLRVSGKIFLHSLEELSKASWFGFPITVLNENKKNMVEYLEKNKIGTRSLFAGNIIKQPAYIQYDKQEDFRNSDIVMNNTFWIGCHPGIGDKEIAYIVQTIERYFK